MRASRGTDQPGTTVAGALVSALRAHGVDRLFSVAGESFLPLLDALLDAVDIDLVTCRHEGSAGFAAIGDAKLTGRPGVCLVSRGPGAANVAAAVHASHQDATPLLVIAGQVPRASLGRGSFQEFDPVALFGGITKGVWVLHSAGRTAEFCHQALHHARSGTPGPVVLAIPEDVFNDDAGHWPAPAAVRSAGGPAPDVVRAVLTLLNESARPLILAGGLLSDPAGRLALARAAQGHGIPVVCSNKHQDLFDNTDGLYAGHLSNSMPSAQRAALSRTDLCLAVGTRLDAVTTARYTWPCARTGDPPLIHVYPDELRVGERYQPRIGICADPATFLTALAREPSSGRGSGAWAAELNALTAAQRPWTPVSADDGVVFGAVATAIDRLAGGTLVLVVDAGGFTSWLYRHVRIGARGRLLGVGSSTMGFAVPAAVAAALRRPSEPVICVVGDGGFQMNGSELAVAAERNARLTVVIANNSCLGTIRDGQERAFPGRVIGTSLANPDFAALATAYGALGLTVTSPDAIEPALAKALDYDGPAVIDVRTSLTHLSAARLLGAGRRP